MSDSVEVRITEGKDNYHAAFYHPDIMDGELPACSVWQRRDFRQWYGPMTWTPAEITHSVSTTSVPISEAKAFVVCLQKAIELAEQRNKETGVRE